MKKTTTIKSPISRRLFKSIFPSVPIEPKANRERRENYLADCEKRGIRGEELGTTIEK